MGTAFPFKLWDGTFMRFKVLIHDITLGKKSRKNNLTLCLLFYLINGVIQLLCTTVTS